MDESQLRLSSFFCLISWAWKIRGNNTAEETEYPILD